MRKFGELGFALIGTWVIATSAGLLSLPMSWLAAQSGQPASLTARAVALDFVPFIIAIALGVALIIFRRRLSESWFEDSQVDVSANARNLLQLGLILIGVSTSIRGISGAFLSLASSIQRALESRAAGAGSYESGWLGVSMVPGIVVGLLTLALGVALIVNARPLAKRLWPVEREDA